MSLLIVVCAFVFGTYMIVTAEAQRVGHSGFAWNDPAGSGLMVPTLCGSIGAK